MISFFVPHPVTEHKLALARRLYGPDVPMYRGDVCVRWVGTKPTRAILRMMHFAGYWVSDDGIRMRWEYATGPLPGIWVEIKEVQDAGHD